ncbi:hypothetical protein ILYODFUR_035663 [Ilyodon furcidens]|uniref:Uncharacterized protein n=1 Tax=Ilyodon furcidens TaxID=33524 RepID=A0ABV0TSH4_9TELE
MALVLVVDEGPSPRRPGPLKDAAREADFRVSLGVEISENGVAVLLRCFLFVSSPTTIHQRAPCSRLLGSTWCLLLHLSTQVQLIMGNQPLPSGSIKELEASHSVPKC